MSAEVQLRRISEILRAYIVGTAALEEAFADIRQLLIRIPAPERAALIRDELWPIALKTDFEKGTIERIQYEMIRPKPIPQRGVNGDASKPKSAKQYGLWKIVDSLSEGGQA